MSDRKFFKTIVQITVLTEDEPWDGPDLTWLPHDITDGDAVGYDFTTEPVEVSAEQMADLLTEAGSDPGFFGLDEEQG